MSVVRRRLPVLSPVAETAAVEPAVSREQRRSRRKHVARPKTISMKRLTKRERDANAWQYERDVEALGGVHPERPKTRAECCERVGDGPCGFVSCRWNLFVDVSPRTGAIKMNFSDIAPDRLNLLPETCALRAADRRGATLEEVGAMMCLTRERTRQIEQSALKKLRLAGISLRDFATFVDDGRPFVRAGLGSSEP